jgi:hypothetical protein
MHLNQLERMALHFSILRIPSDDRCIAIPVALSMNIEFKMDLIMNFMAITGLLVRGY